MDLTLHVWRQRGPGAEGEMKTYPAPGISEEMSFLEMLDVVNQRLEESDEEPIVFDHDCREGICGACGMMINGVAHGPEAAITACQLHMRFFSDGDEITIEPWRSAAFPVIKDLMVDRSAFDRIIQAGGYISVNTGSAPDANSTPVPKDDADRSMEKPPIFFTVRDNRVALQFDVKIFFAEYPNEFFNGCGGAVDEIVDPRALLGVACHFDEAVLHGRRRRAAVDNAGAVAAPLGQRLARTNERG